MRMRSSILLTYSEIMKISIFILSPQKKNQSFNYKSIVLIIKSSLKEFSLNNKTSAPSSTILPLTHHPSIFIALSRVSKWRAHSFNKSPSSFNLVWTGTIPIIFIWRRVRKRLGRSLLRFWGRIGKRRVWVCRFWWINMKMKGRQWDMAFFLLMIWRRATTRLFYYMRTHRWLVSWWYNSRFWMRNRKYINLKNSKQFK